MGDVMRVARQLAVCCAFLACAVTAAAQESLRLERLLGVPVRQRPAASLPAPEGFAERIVGGKLTLALEDAIRLALANSTDIRLDHTQVDFAKNGLHRSYSPFDPLFSSSFNDQRAQSSASTQLQGAALLNTLTQATQLNYGQIFPTGTNFQTSFNAEKLSTNSSFNFINPSISTFLQFTVTQPLLRNRGLFPNRAPILI